MDKWFSSVQNVAVLSQIERIIAPFAKGKHSLIQSVKIPSINITFYSQMH